MFRQAMTLGAVGLAFSANVSLAQTEGTYRITFEGVVTPQTPTLTVSIWATWNDPPRDWVFGGGNYDLEASEGEFVSGTLKLGRDPPNTWGLLSGSRVIGAGIGQVHLPGSWIGNFDNPILLASYEWTTTDFTLRTIDFVTSNTSHFILADARTGATKQLVPNQLSPGSAAYVIPAPSTLGLIACGGLVAVRRRRRMSGAVG